MLCKTTNTNIKFYGLFGLIKCCFNGCKQMIKFSLQIHHAQNFNIVKVKNLCK